MKSKPFGKCICPKRTNTKTEFPRTSSYSLKSISKKPLENPQILLEPPGEEESKGIYHLGEVQLTSAGAKADLGAQPVTQNFENTMGRNFENAPIICPPLSYSVFTAQLNNLPCVAFSLFSLPAMLLDQDSQAGQSPWPANQIMRVGLYHAFRFTGYRTVLFFHCESLFLIDFGPFFQVFF